MVKINSPLIFLVQGLAALTNTPSPTSSCSCSLSTTIPILALNQANITSPTTIKAGKDFTITWTSPDPNRTKNNTESRIELWAANGGPASSATPIWKSSRIFNQYNYTHNFPESYVNMTTRGGPIIWKLFVAVYSTYYDNDSADLEAWNLPYYDTEIVKFV
jgi:hypothetical protein